MLNCYVLVGLDWVEPILFLSLILITCSSIFHAYVPSFIFILILICVVAFLYVSFFLSFNRLVALWHLNENPFRPKTLFVLGHLLLLTQLLLTYGSMMIKPVKTFWRTSHDEAFILNAKLFYWTFPILTFPLSSTVGVRSHCVASWSLVPPWSYRSFTPTCTDSVLQYLILSLVFEVCAL